MPRSLLNLILKHTAPDADPDAVLLRRYAATKDESAFAALVRRHGPMVWAVCRQSVPNRADAEDVFQATFLALATASSKVRGPERLGGWLYAAAVRIAGKAKRGHARRTKHERATARPITDSPVSAAAWSDLLAAVHEEVAGLPPSLRAAFVLCDLQGTDPAAAAKQLGVKANTLTGHLARARQRVAAALGKRGIAAGAVGLAVAGGLPEALANKLAGGVVPSAAVLELSSEVATMGVNKLKLLAAGLLLAGGLTASGLGLISHAGAQDPAGGNPPATVPGLPGSSGPGGIGGPGMVPALPAPGGPGGFLGMAPGGPPATVAPAPAALKGFEYLFVAKPGTLNAVAKLLKDKASGGWEYTGPLDVDPADPPKGSEYEGVTKDTRVVLVFFKRGGRPVAMPTASRGGPADPFAGGGFGPADAYPGGRGGGSLPLPSLLTAPGGALPGIASGGGGPSVAVADADERYEVLSLKRADAEAVAKILTEVFNGSNKVPGRVRIVADAKTNSLIVVKASDGDMKLIGKLLKTLDDDPNAK